jgi:hypothetical protein
MSPLIALPAFAHAILESSEPANGATIPAGKTPFTLTFNSRIDQARSKVTLTAADQSQQVLPLAESTAPNILTSSADLAPGRYVLRWQVLSVDGHITRGQFAITVAGN